MTAQVSATEFTVAGGSVTFTDTYNGVSEVLGTVQVQSTNGNAGTAILETEVGGVGDHQFIASYSGTAMFATSSSSPQSVTFVGPYLSATALASYRHRAQRDAYRNRIRIRPVGSNGKCHLHRYHLKFVLGTAPLNAGTLQNGFTPYTLYPIANMNNGQTGSTTDRRLVTSTGTAVPTMQFLPTPGP